MTIYGVLPDLVLAFPLDLIGIAETECSEPLTWR